MALAEFLAELDNLAREATQAFSSAMDGAAVEAARIEFVGARSGRLKDLQRELGRVDKADKPAAGKRFNEVKQQIEAALDAATARLAEENRVKAEVQAFDPTVPGTRLRLGHLHPITQTIEELKDIMGRLGFTVADGPEVEDPWHNFEALNIPLEHPARDPLENFYLAAAAKSTSVGTARPHPGPLPKGEGTSPFGSHADALPKGEGTSPFGSHADALPKGEGTLPFGPQPGPLPKGEGTSPFGPHADALPKGEGTSPFAPHPGPLPKGEGTHIPSPGGPGELLLRSQTSTVQIRVMEKTRPPVRVISVGRVYRPDTADATHFPMFHQIEGLLVDRQVTMSDLKSVLRLFARSAFADDVHIRFRPSFFPFTEPSVEVDMSWQGGWIEMGGAGMVDPNVLSAVGYDPEGYAGFAFGLGIERICARRHGVTDIREFFKNDVRFLHQF
jgi:phenylalanyl-tRNA synthetase alpha subunit